jgi:hypothetical protein
MITQRRDKAGCVTLSPSNAYRYTQCSGSCLTPLVPEPPSGWVAARGTKIHAKLAAMSEEQLKRLGVLSDTDTLVSQEAPIKYMHLQGTVDIVYREGDGSLVVADYKTGNIDNPAYNMQVSIYGLGAGAGEGELIHVNPKTGAITKRRLPIVEPERELLSITRPIEYVKGAWCKYCPVKESGMCPAK